MSQETMLGEAEVTSYAVVRSASGDVKRIIRVDANGVSTDLTPEQYRAETGEEA